MDEPQLILNPDRVPLGVSVYLCRPGRSAPAKARNRRPLPPMQLRHSADERRTSWYVFEKDGSVLRIASFPFGSEAPGTRFIPVEMFRAADAPVRSVYVVFVDGEAMAYGEYPELEVEVVKLTDGRILSWCGRASSWWKREMPLPDRALLVRRGPLGEAMDFELMGCIGIPKPAQEQRAVLEGKGIVFYDHAPFSIRHWRTGVGVDAFSFADYVAVRLPPKWSVVESDAWYMDCPFAFEIQDENGHAVARVRQRPDECMLRARWSGTISI